MTNVNGAPGLCHGQQATCEIIVTPVTADVAYFQKSNSPRGRAACVVSCENYNQEVAEGLIYDHSRPDAAYEYRSTVNPWASQLGSLGDIMYNSSYRQTAVPGLYSPCRAFFNKEELLRNNRGLYNMVNEYSQRLGGHPATSLLTWVSTPKTSLASFRPRPLATSKSTTTSRPRWALSAMGHCFGTPGHTWQV